MLVIPEWTVSGLFNIRSKNSTPSGQGVPVLRFTEWERRIWQIAEQLWFMTRLVQVT